MLANLPPHYHGGHGGHHIGYGQLAPRDLIWKSAWPYKISFIIGILIMIFAFVIFVLEIALLGVIGSAVLTGVYSAGVGIWCGVLIFIAGVLIIILNWVTSVYFWAIVALIGAIEGAIFSIIHFSINASRVQIASLSGVFGYPDSRVASLGGLPAAELAFGIILFLLCLAFIGLYISTALKISGRRSHRQYKNAISTQKP